MIEITEKLTEDNIHLIFSAAEASRKENEIIHVIRSLTLNNLAIDHLPDYLIINGYLEIINCPNLITLSDPLEVMGNIFLLDQPYIKKLPLTLIAGFNIFPANVARFKLDNPTFKNQIREY